MSTTKKFASPPTVPTVGRLKSICSGTSEVFKLDPRIISREPGFNVRHDFGEIQTLADDILANGILESLKVRKEGDKILLINGDRRLTAVELLIKNNLWPADPAAPRMPMPVPCTSEGRSVTPIDRIFMMLSLNTGKPFTLLEKGNAYLRILTEDASINASEIARRSGETKQAVSNALTLVRKASPSLIQLVEDATISATSALEIIKNFTEHADQDIAAAAAIAAAKSNGRDHAMPKDLPTQPTKSKPSKINSDWSIHESEPSWNEHKVATDGSSVIATGAKWGINVKEHAPLSAAAGVDHGVGIETKGGHENGAADRGCSVSSCSPFFIHGETPDVWIVGMNPESRFDCGKLADQIIAEWNTSSVKPKEIILGGVRASIPASWVMQNLLNLGLPVRELTNQDLQVSALRDRIDQYGCSVSPTQSIPENAASRDTFAMSSVEAHPPEVG